MELLEIQKLPTAENSAIHLHPSDNVAIVVSPDGYQARERVPQSHKVTLVDLAAGEPILRYGYVIGHALRAIPAGSWVREDMLDLPEPPPLDQLPLATKTPAPQPPLEGYTFEGYLNPDGSTATRNILGLATTAFCGCRTIAGLRQRCRRLWKRLRSGLRS